MSYKRSIDIERYTPTRHIEYSTYTGPRVVERYTPVLTRVEEAIEDNDKKNINIVWKTEKSTNTSNPKVWGSMFWFSLHNGASKYPNAPNTIHKERMKGFILGIPFMLPCVACKPEAIGYIESRKQELDQIVSSRDNLVKFFVDFHNSVNRRYAKREFSYDEAKQMYDKGVNVTYASYE
jgi:hypothetical protein